MGRKVKSSICLIIVLILIYLQQSVIYAEDQVYEGTTPETESFETEEKNDVDKTEEKQNDEEDGKKDREDELEKDGEQQDDTDHSGKQIRRYQMEISEPDGRQGYYVTVPQVEITHVSEVGSTVCELWYQEEMVLQKILSEQSESFVIDAEAFREGEQRLEVYMADAEGGRVNEYDFSQEILIDTQPPEVKVLAEHGFDTWYQKEAWIHVEGVETEEESQIESIICYCGNQIVGRSDQRQADFLIRQTSKSGEGVNVTVVACDMAGNKSEQSNRLFIDSVQPTVSFVGATDYMITSQHVIITAEATDDNWLKSCNVITDWETPEGDRQIIPETEWQIDTRDGVQVQSFDQDGIYRMQLEAEDASGLVSAENLQFIIDQTNPYVRYVDELNGQYMKNFRWNYPAEAYIQDFTSYTCQMLLDGEIYPVGKCIDLEGRHTLEVDVLDAAGNRASAQAGFVIDHTPPQIEFQEIAEGESYEKEKDFTVQLEDKTDRFSDIKVNGKSQEYKKTDREWSFTASEPDTYHVEVEAVDLAGNKSCKSIWFEVIPEKNLLEQMTTPVRRLFGKEKGDKKKTVEEITDEVEEKEENRTIQIIGCLSFVAIAVICFIKWRMPGIALRKTRHVL